MKNTMKRITFSRTFPKYHPKAGQATHFVEKIYESAFKDGFGDDFEDILNEINHNVGFFTLDEFVNSLSDNSNITPKHHTIRAGNKWKAGDRFLPVVWSGEPYRSKQIVIAPPIEIVKTWDIYFSTLTIDRVTQWAWSINDGVLTHDDEVNLAKNDGLDWIDLLDWFRRTKRGDVEFDGQIICWNENVNY